MRTDDGVLMNVGCSNSSKINNATHFDECCVADVAHS